MNPMSVRRKTNLPNRAKLPKCEIFGNTAGFCSVLTIISQGTIDFSKKKTFTKYACQFNQPNAINRTKNS
jgi:hypothetical protein